MAQPSDDLLPVYTVMRSSCGSSSVTHTEMCSHRRSTPGTKPARSTIPPTARTSGTTQDLARNGSSPRPTSTRYWTGFEPTARDGRTACGQSCAATKTSSSSGFEALIQQPPRTPGRRGLRRRRPDRHRHKWRVSFCGTPVAWFTGVWPDARIEHFRSVTEYDRDRRSTDSPRARAGGAACSERGNPPPAKPGESRYRGRPYSVWPGGPKALSHTLREPLPVLTLALTRNFGCMVGIPRRPQAR
jgi:hypothetical protein